MAQLIAFALLLFIWTLLLVPMFVDYEKKPPRGTDFDRRT